MTTASKGRYLSPAVIARRIAALGLNGFGGACLDAALAINAKVFGGKGKIVGVANSFWLERGRFLGHVAVLYRGRYWDVDARPDGPYPDGKDWEDIESWGMLDPHDSEYYAFGWDDVEAETVTRLEGRALLDAWGRTEKV